MWRIGIRLALVAGVLLAVVVAWLCWEPRSTRYAELCRRAIEGRQWRELAGQSQSWTEAEPANAQAWLYRAEAAQHQQDLASVCRFLANVPPESEFGIHAWETRIELQFGPLNQPLAAAESCQRLLKSDPNSKVAHQRLIYFYAMTLQRRKLIEQVRDAVARSCEPREAYTYLFFADSLRLSNAGSQNLLWLESDPGSELFAVAQAIAIGEALEGQTPRDDPDVLAKIKESVDRRDRTLLELLQKYPHNLELLAFFLRQAVEQGDANRVADLLAEAPAEAEFDNRFWRYRGWLLQHHDDLVEAEAAYTQALKLHPLDWGTRHLLAGLMRRKGDLAEAGRHEQLVMLANPLRVQLQKQETVRWIPTQILKDLSAYAAGCQDRLIAESLNAQMQRFDRTKDPRK